MKKHEAQSTITDLVTECDRLETENRALRDRLTAVTLCLGKLVGVSSGLHAYLIDEYFLSKQLESEHLTSDKCPQNPQRKSEDTLS